MARRRLYRFDKEFRRDDRQNSWAGWTLLGGASIRSGGEGDEAWTIVEFTPTYSGMQATVNLPTLTEMKFTRMLRDFDGKADVFVDNAIVHQIKGPQAWEFSHPIKLMPGNRPIRFQFTSQTTVAHWGNISFYNYEEINCMFRKPTPFKQEHSPTSHDILRGFSVFQQTKKGHAVSEFMLYFNNPTAYLDFMANSSKIHVVKDEFGVHYRGVLEINEVNMITETCIYVECTFRSPYQAGVGW